MIARIQAWLYDLTFDVYRRFQLFSLVRQGTTLVASIFLANSALTTADIGTYETWLYWGMILTFICFSGSLQAYVSDYSQDVANSKNSNPFAIYLLTSGGALIAVLGFYSVCQLIGEPMGTETNGRLIKVLFFLWLHLSSSVIPYILLVQKMVRWFYPYTLFYALGYILAISYPLFWGGGHLDDLLIGLIYFSIVEYLSLIFLLVVVSRMNFSFHRIRQLISLAIPLTIYGGMGLMAQIFDAWLVQWTFGDMSTFAQFRYGARELPGALALAAAFTTAMLVEFRNEGKNGLIRIKKGSTKLMHLFFPFSMILMLISPYLFELIFNVDFVRSAWIFNTYLLLMTSRWLFPQVMMVVLKENNRLIRYAVLELMVNVILSLLLIRYWGLVGVALATVVAFGLEKWWLGQYLYRKYGMKWSDYVSIETWSFYSLGSLIVYLVAMVIWGQI